MVEDFQENYGTGWIKMFRSIQKHWIWSKNTPLTKFEAWCTILFEVNHSDAKISIGYDVFECNRGESLNSLHNWSKLFNWNKSKVRRFFNMLQKEKMICFKSVSKTTHLTVCNYENYQSIRNASETQVKRTRNAREPKQEERERKEEKENTFLKRVYFDKSKELDEAFKDYLRLRIKSKFTMTDRAINALVNKLRAMSNGNVKDAIKLIDSAIIGKWKTFYTSDK